MPAVDCGDLLSEPRKAGALGSPAVHCRVRPSSPGADVGQRRVRPSPTRSGGQGQMGSSQWEAGGDLSRGQVRGPGVTWAGESAGPYWVPEDCVPMGRLGLVRAGPPPGTAAELARRCPVFSPVPWSAPTSTSCGSWARRGRSTGPRWSSCTGATRSSRRPWPCPCPRRAAPARAAARPPASREGKRESLEPGRSSRRPARLCSFTRDRHLSA